MNDYKKLITDLRMFAMRLYGNGTSIMQTAADAIEQLVKERDAAVADLKGLNKRYGAYCRYCKGSKCGFKPENGRCSACLNWEWRGVQSGEENK